MTRILEPQLVGNDDIARLLDTAAASTRKRAHLLLHADHQDQVQRLLIGLEPPSYVRPHVHSEHPRCAIEPANTTSCGWG